MRPFAATSRLRADKLSHRRAESPRAVARWRCLTYQGLEPAFGHKTPAEEALVAILTKLFGRHQVALNFPEWSSSLEAIFREALSYQKLVRKDYLSSDFFVFHPAPQGDSQLFFEPASMTDESGTKNEMTGEQE